MKRSIALALLIVVAAAAVPGLAWAGGSEDAALALGAFAVFNQLMRGETVLHDIFGGGRHQVVHERVVVHQPPAVVYAPPPRPVVYAPPPPPVVYAPVHVVPSRPVVVYPRGYKVHAPKAGAVVVVPRGYKVHAVKPVRPVHVHRHYHDD